MPNADRPGAPTCFAETIAALTERAAALAASGSRRLLGITGPPGAGKSTVCAAMIEALGERAALIGMDAFHLSNEQLIRLGRRDRKGAPDTFDVDGYVALLRRARAEADRTVYAPRFDRGIEESICAAVAIEPQVSLVITECNYLLMPDGGWQDVRPALDEVWCLEVSEQLTRQRVVARRQSFGTPPAQARAVTEQVDVRNAGLVAAHRERADLIVTVPDDPAAVAGHPKEPQ
ncbi:nucleoside/nucleotide kinase family protein [Mycolicibacterium brumae]|uniref:nucleoside/nucleotide kinase family protein n=1 Tax=Mycolicibacterium brumae TaxID=85968 RepID=UPI000B10F476|nr:nucleoside/nucleotide kinase family protein [Mycolicibacterium brumae]UWW08112.1 nucleoside/nucleotide kinase family protein [Mycolicibacterium brumae]